MSKHTTYIYNIQNCFKKTKNMLKYLSEVLLNVMNMAQLVLQLFNGHSQNTTHEDHVII